MYSKYRLEMYKMKMPLSGQNSDRSDKTKFQVFPETGSPPHRENRENGHKIPCQGKHREFGNFAKTKGIWVAQVVNSMILNV